MKKTISLLLALVLCLSLCACGSGASTTQNQTQDTETTEESVPVTEALKEYYSIGDEVTSAYFSFTLKEVGVTDSLSFVFGTDESLLLEGSPSVNADSGKKWLCYTVEYQYLGKKSINAISSLFSPVVTYGDYTFDRDYFVFDAEIGTWKWYLSDYDGTVTGLPVPATHGVSPYYEPLNGKTYCVKGAIQVPDAVFDGTEGSVILNLRNCTEYETSGVIMERVKFDISGALK